MPNIVNLHIQNLKLDLKNYRTMEQNTEEEAIQTMISINPNWFWALMESLISDGYLPTENIIILKREVGSQTQFIVKEGNRRVAALKLAFFPNEYTSIEIPSHLKQIKSKLQKSWFDANEILPCSIYDESELDKVERIIELTHGKGIKAGRDKWNTVARARHNRDVLNVNEPSLDLLEKYIKISKNISEEQKKRWSGDFPLTVLAECMKKSSQRLKCANSKEIADKYPKITYRKNLEAMILDIGLKKLRFKELRDKVTNFLDSYKIPDPNKLLNTPSAQAGTPPSAETLPPAGTSTSVSTSHGSSSTASQQSSHSNPQYQASAGQSNQGNPQTTQHANTSGSSSPAASSLANPQTVIAQLESMQINGQNRAKVVTLRDEAVKLKINKTPLAFCFLLRSMFEISAKAYCTDHQGSNNAPKYVKNNGRDRNLIDVLRDTTAHITQNSTNTAKTRKLHGAMAELGNQNAMLSVTSMNQLVHNPTFSVTPSDICIVFNNIFPLLEEMNI